MYSLLQNPMMLLLNFALSLLVVDPGPFLLRCLACVSFVPKPTAKRATFVVQIMELHISS